MSQSFIKLFSRRPRVSCRVVRRGGRGLGRHPRLIAPPDREPEPEHDPLPVDQLGVPPFVDPEVRGLAPLAEVRGRGPVPLWCHGVNEPPVEVAVSLQDVIEVWDAQAGRQLREQLVHAALFGWGLGGVLVLSGGRCVAVDMRPPCAQVVLCCWG